MLRRPYPINGYGNGVKVRAVLDVLPAALDLVSVELQLFSTRKLCCFIWAPKTCSGDVKELA